MTTFNYPADEHHYRDQTAGQSKMPGVTLPSFRCVACRRIAGTKGCKTIAIGRICAACVKAREARRAKGAA